MLFVFFSAIAKLDWEITNIIFRVNFGIFDILKNPRIQPEKISEFTLTILISVTLGKTHRDHFIRMVRANSDLFLGRILRFFKGSSDTSHFIFEINVGKRRFRHRTTSNLNQVIFQNQLKMRSFKIQSRSMSDPTHSDNDFKNKILWVWTTRNLFMIYLLTKRGRSIACSASSCFII